MSNKIMTTIYLEDYQMEFFKKHPELSMSAIIRKKIDEYIKKR